jgi:hypothetical protein
MRTIIPYEETQFVFVTNHWDIHLKGYCIYEGKWAIFEAHDDTDYEEMSANCKYCSGRSTDDDDCDCENYTDVICFITPLTLRERTRARLHKWWFEFCVGSGWSFTLGKKNIWKYKSMRLRLFYYFLKNPTKHRFKEILLGKYIKNG